MNNQIKICTKNIIKLLLDKEWHDLYELHTKYHILPSELLTSLNALLEKGIIELGENNTARLGQNLNNTQVSFINKIYKTKKPERLRNSFLDK